MVLSNANAGSTSTQIIAFTPNASVQSSVFEGTITRTPSLESLSKGTSTKSKPATHGTGGTTPTMPRTPITPPKNGYKRPVPMRTANILHEVYGKARPYIPAIPAAGAGGGAAATTGFGFATFATVFGSVFAACGILDSNNSLGKVKDWIKGQFGIGKAEDEKLSASLSYSFMRWNADKIATVLKKLPPEHSKRLTAEATRLGEGMRDAERFSPQHVVNGMTNVLKSIGLDKNGESLSKKPKFTPPKQPLHQIGIGHGKDKKKDLVSAEPRKAPLKVAQNIAAPALIPSYKTPLNAPKKPIATPHIKPAPKGGGLGAPFVEGLELFPLVKQDGSQERVKKQDENVKQQTRSSASDGRQEIDGNNYGYPNSPDAYRKRVEAVKSKFKQKIEKTASEKNMSLTSAYYWLIKYDPNVAATLFGISTEQVKLLKEICLSKDLPSIEIIITYFEHVAKGEFEIKYAEETLYLTFFNRNNIIGNYQTVSSLPSMIDEEKARQDEYYKNELDKLLKDKDITIKIKILNWLRENLDSQTIMMHPIELLKSADMSKKLELYLRNTSSFIPRN
jgi:hypothetical protein